MASNFGNVKYVKLYSARAHLFQIDPETRNSWLPKGRSAIPISFIASMNEANDDPSGRKELKIIGTDENNQTILDRNILLKTQFNKRSPKFGQWNDPTGTVYGLGFDSETDLDDFVEIFQQLQLNIFGPHTSTNNSQPVAPANEQSENSSGWNRPQGNLDNGSETNSREFRSASNNGGGEDLSPSQYSNTMTKTNYQQMTRRQQQHVERGEHDNSTTNNNNADENDAARYSRDQTHTKTNNGLLAGRSTPETEGSTLSQGEWQLKEQLKQATYENERLKQALEESSKNTGIWHNELLNLRTNNVKLTQALQESKAHVEEWERELLNLRGENREFKLRVTALESADDPGKNNDFKSDLQNYREYVDEMQGKLRERDEEIEQLQKSMEQMELKLKKSLSRNGISDDAGSIHDDMISTHQKQRFDIINAKLETKINEITNIQKELAQLVGKLQ